MTVRSFKGISPQLGAGVYIDPMATVIGDVHMGENCSAWPSAVIRGDVHKIRIGARSNVQDGAVLHVTHAGPYTGDGKALIIGDDVTIGHNATLHACTLGNRILIGMGAIVLDGAVIPDDVVIGAGAMVTPGKKLESGFLYVGSPAKKARALSEQELIYFAYTANNYVELMTTYKEESEQ